MKRWLDALLGLALVAAWAVVALTASDSTLRVSEGDVAASANKPVALRAVTASPTRV
jgi:hypothetical protein